MTEKPKIQIQIPKKSRGSALPNPWRKAISLLIVECFLTTSLFIPSGLAFDEHLPSWTAKKTFHQAPGFDLLRQRAAKEGAVKEIQETLTAKDGGDDKDLSRPDTHHFANVDMDSVIKHERSYTETFSSFESEPLRSNPAIKELLTLKTQIDLNEAVSIYAKEALTYGVGRYQWKDPVTLYTDLTQWSDFFGNKITSFAGYVQLLGMSNERNEKYETTIRKSGRIVVAMHYLKEMIDAGELTPQESLELFLKTLYPELQTHLDHMPKWMKHHEAETVEMSGKIGKALGLSDSEQDTLRLIAYYHDIGKDDVSQVNLLDQALRQLCNALHRDPGENRIGGWVTEDPLPAYEGNVHISPLPHHTLLIDEDPVMSAAILGFKDHERVG